MTDTVFTRENKQNLAQFFTAKPFCDLLVDSMDMRRPNYILDLGSGTGALALAARRRWNDAKIVTVDVDKNIDLLFQSKPLVVDPNMHRHIFADVLNSGLPRLISSENPSFDVAISNPPYLFPAWRPCFSIILEEAGLLPAIGKASSVGSDVIFIAQTLRMVKEGGQVGLIVPDSLITGKKLKAFREFLLTQHSVKQVLQLPRRAFVNTDAQTYILVLTKSVRNTEPVIIQKIAENGHLSEKILISPKVGIERMDFDYHYAKLSFSEPSTRMPTTLRMLDAQITRGSISSSEAKICKHPILHLPALPSVPCQKFSIPSCYAEQTVSSDSSAYTIVQKNDFIMPRVGRNFQNRTCLVSSGKAIITDWIYRVRIDKKENREIAKELLLSERGCKLVASHASGTGASQISKNTLLDLVF